MPLVEEQRKRGMFYTGTIRQSWMPGCDLTSESELRKAGRGSYDHRIEDNIPMCAIRWYDNRAVSMLSSEVGVEPVTEAARWDKKTLEYVAVPMSTVIGTYNKHIGGIDLGDS